MTKEQEDKIINLIKRYAEASKPEEYKFAKEQGVLDKIINGLDITPCSMAECRYIHIDGDIEDAIKYLQSLKDNGYDFIILDNVDDEYPENGQCLQAYRDIQESEEKMAERLSKRLVHDIIEYHELRRKEIEMQKRLQKYK